MARRAAGQPQVGDAASTSAAARTACEEAGDQYAQLLAASVPPPQAEIDAVAAEAERREQELSHRVRELAAARTNLESLIGES